MKRSLLAVATLAMLVTASPSWSQGAPTPFASLGPLAGSVTPGSSGAWTVRDESGRAVLTDAATPGAIRFYSTDWQGSLEAGRAVSVRVGAKGDQSAAAGLLFRLTNQDPRWLAFVLQGDGKLGLFARLPSELKRVGTFDLPGGHRADGDVLAISQTGDTALLLANGALVRTLSPQDGMSPNAPAPVGVVAMGKGEFTLGQFGFGPAITPVAAPAPGGGGTDDTVPTPSAGNDTFPAPAPVTPQPTGVATLGPLGRDFKLGDDQGWHLALQPDKALVVTHQAEDDLYYFNRYIGWAGPQSGRSASVSVQASGSTKSSGAGLLFGMSPDGKDFWQLLVTGDDKIKLFQLKDNTFTLQRTFDSPSGPGVWQRLSVRQVGGTLTMLLGDTLLDTLDMDKSGVPRDGRVGIGMRGNGKFLFRDFAFGTDTAPTSSSSAQYVEVPTLGPLGHHVRLGLNSGWDTSVTASSITYAHPAGDDAGWFYRTIGWPAGEQSASITVETDATEADHGAGLSFGLRPDGSGLLMYTLDGDGKLRVFRMGDRTMSTLLTLSPAGPPRATRRLRITRRGTAIEFYADDALLRSVASAELGGVEGDAGLGVVGSGRYTFRDFAFGTGPAPDAPPPRPAPTAPQAPSPTQAAPQPPRAGAPTGGPLLALPTAPRPGTALQSWTLESFGALFGIVAEEYGRFVIGELHLPLAGSETDMADEFAATLFIEGMRAAPQEASAMGAGSAMLWWFMANDRSDPPSPFLADHAPDRARFLRYACMLYGAAPGSFGDLMDRAQVPERDKQRCVNDAFQRRLAWDKRLAPYRRRDAEANLPGDLDPNTPGHTMGVTYALPKDPALRPFAEEVQRSHIFDFLAESITKLYALPRDAKIVFRDCGTENAFYSPTDGSITVCWETIRLVMTEFARNGVPGSARGMPPASPTPVMAVPSAPASAPRPPSPQTPSPQTPALQTPALQTPALQTPAPQAPAPQASPAQPPAAPGAGLEQRLIGSWQETVTGNGQNLDMALQLMPLGRYQARIQISGPQAMTVNVQGTWSVASAGGNRANISFVPQHWTPPQAPMRNSTVLIELVDRDTFRSSDGLAHRLP